MRATYKDPRDVEAEVDETADDAFPPEGGDSVADDAVALRATTELGQLGGEIGAQDLQAPYLQITYGVGGLAENYSLGDLVLGGENLLVHKDTPLELVILRAFVYWKEYLSNEDFKAKIRPRTFATEADVHKAGLTTTWTRGPDGTDQGPQCNRAMRMDLIIEQPKDVVCGLFGVELEGKLYAPARFAVDKTAYRKLAPVIVASAKYRLQPKGGLYVGRFQLTTTVGKVNSNVTVIPSIKFVGENTPDFIASVRQLFSL
jgi:hypothetical protein